MLTETRSERRVEVRRFPGPKAEALLGLLVFPIGLLIGIKTALVRLLRSAKPLPDEPQMRIEPGDEPMRDVAAFAARYEEGDFSPRWGFGLLDFQLAYAPDLIPSVLDLDPKLANKFSVCPPPFRRITVESLDGTPLAVEVATRDDRERPGLVVVHGTFGSSGQEIYAKPAIRAFSEWGFNVAIVDLRGWGRSAALSDAPMSGGWREADDVIAAARWLVENSRTSSVGAIGYSLGGAAVLNAAAHELAPKYLAGGVFSESGFADARQIMQIADDYPGVLSREFIVYLIFHFGLRLKMRRGGGRALPLADYVEHVAAPRYGVAPDEIYDLDSPVTTVAEIRVPALHLHAVDDWVVSVEHAYTLRHAADECGNRLVGVCVEPRGAHCAFARVAGEWRERIARDFFSRTNGIRLVDRSV